MTPKEQQNARILLDEIEQALLDHARIESLDGFQLLAQNVLGLTIHFRGKVFTLRLEAPS